MTQAALFSFDTPDTSSDLSAHDLIGFEIGWDHAHYRLVPPADHLHTGHPVRQGWQAGRAAFGQRSLRPTGPVRQWLALRLKAWLAGDDFEGLLVTPNFLAQLAGARCPVTHEPLGDDAQVERLFLGAGYAAGNLAALSPRAAAAKAQCGWHDAMDFAQQIDDGLHERIAGLDAHEWRRLAVLMSFATPLKHAHVAGLPLLVLPPNRLRVLNPVQALQTLLTLQFCQPGFGRHIADLAVLMPSSVARQAFQIFMHTLLARRVAAGPLAQGAALRQAMEDAWLHPLVQRRWQRLALSLTEADCERIVRTASRRGLTGGECRWLDADAATDGWALETRGQCATHMPRAPQRRDALRSAVRAGGFQAHLPGLAGQAAL